MNQFDDMKTIRNLVLITIAILTGESATSNDLTKPIINQEVVFEEEKGVLAVEAEHFFRQTKTDPRAWYLHSTVQQAVVKPDGDEAHLIGASGGGYLEALPDTRRTHDDKLIKGENFSNEPGKQAILDYKVWINTPGRYYVWVRTYSTGTEDNGLHVGIDGEWPESGRRLQWTAKRKWFWDSKQRTAKVHTGVPGLIFLDIKEKGPHTISFSMREDGFEFDKWMITTTKDLPRPEGEGPKPKVKTGKLPAPFPALEPKSALSKDNHSSPAASQTQEPRGKDGDGSIEITGENRVWHTTTLTVDGPFASEADQRPNPFRDYRLMAEFAHQDGTKYRVEGYFAADGNAAHTSASSGNKWRVHFTPDRVGLWRYKLQMIEGLNAATRDAKAITEVKFAKSTQGTIQVTETNKKNRDLRAHGRLKYVGKRYLQFAGSKKYFLKAGADAPETLLGYADFDGTEARKANVPLKKYKPHLRDWRDGDPQWKDGQGKGLIGAVNYLSSKGCNAFSFLTYNAGGDGDNVWPHVSRNDKLHFDVSKLDQWGIVFDHATTKGMYLHFKLQETENDDNKQKGKKKVPMALNGGDLGIERKLYLREMIARFGHNLALNWNLGEENTQSTDQQRKMASYIKLLDPYDNLIVVHTFPDQQDKVYTPLLGDKSVLRGASLQNSHIRDTHKQTLKWIRRSSESGIPWVVAFDESGSAAHGQCPDLGYQGFDGKDNDGKMIYTQHEVRRQTLWGTLMAGGAGVEYYFGYKFAENDLKCEDWRSRDQSWDYCRIALEFFDKQMIPFWEMENRNRLVGNQQNDNSVYCLAKPGEVYLVYLASDKSKIQLDLESHRGTYLGYWFNPENGNMQPTKNIEIKDQFLSLKAPTNRGDDWLFVLKKE